VEGVWRSGLRARLEAAHRAPTAHERGERYAELIRTVFESIPGVPRTRTKVLNFAGSQEIDIGFWNDGLLEGLAFLRTDIVLIECKNWTERVSSAEVAWFDTKIRQRNLNLGIIFAVQGVTGDPGERSAAQHIIAQALAEGRRLLVVTSDDLASLRSARDMIELLKDKLLDLHMKQADLP
jgi:hypothetical protein